MTDHRGRFLLNELQAFFATHASVVLLDTRGRQRLEASCMNAFVGDLRDRLPPNVGTGIGFYAAFSWDLVPCACGAEAEAEYQLSVAKGDASFFVVPEVPDKYALRCEGRLPSTKALFDHFGLDRPADLVLVDAALTWTFVLLRERIPPRTYFAHALEPDTAPTS